MKRAAVSLTLLALLLALLGAAPNNGASGGGGGGIASLAADTSPQLGGNLETLDFEIQQPKVEYNAAATALITGGEMPFWTRLVATGGIFQCNTASDNTGDICNDNTDCPNGACVRNDGLNGTDGQGTATLCAGSDAFGPNVLDPLGGLGNWAQNNIFAIRYNAGADCEGTDPQSTDSPMVKYNFEMDWRPRVDPFTDALVEFYRETMKPDGTSANSDEWRDFFYGVNTVKGTARHAWSSGQYFGLSSGSSETLGGVVAGAFGAVKSPGVRFSIDNAGPSQALQVEHGTNWGGAEPGGSAASNSHWDQGIQSTLHATSSSSGIQTSLRNITIQDGANVNGACDANSTTLAEGAECVTNPQCNGGVEYNGSNGICVKGDGVDSSGTSDGLCIDSTTGAVQTTGTIFCDDTAGGTGCGAGDTCVDIQDRYPYAVTNLEAARDSVSTAAASSNVHTWGYCSSLGGGTPADEGRQCFRNSHCASNSCVFNNDGSRYTQNMVGRTIELEIADDRTNNTLGVSGSGTEIANLTVLDVEFTWSADNQNIGNTQLLYLRTPTITGTGGSSNSFNQHGLRIGDMHANSQWQAYPLTIDQQSVASANGRHYGINMGCMGWNCAPIRMGELIMFNQGDSVSTSPQTVDVMRIQPIAEGFTANSSDGYALPHATNSASYGPTWWGDVNDTSFDTGTEVCVARGMACEEAFEIGSGAEIGCGVVGTGTTSGHFLVACK